MNNECEKFEFWLLRDIPSELMSDALLAVRQSACEDGNYRQPLMQAFWEGWQARAASPQATATQPAQTERALTDEQREDAVNLVWNWAGLDDHAQRAECCRELRALLTAAQPASGGDQC